MDIRDRYPASAFLLRKERKFLVRRVDGSFDPKALRTAHTLLGTYTSLDVAKRARLQKSVARLLCVGDAVNKGAWSFGDLDAAGKLHTGFGFPIVIEVADGDVRSGIGKDGTKWEKKLNGMSYGFLPDTMAADAEELDVIVGKDITAPMAFIIDQGDEIKLALGYATAQDARDVYEKNWPAGMMKALYEVPMSLVRSLLCAEPDTLAKTLHAATKTDALAVMNAGEMIGTIAKSAMDASTFAGGGAKLPGQAQTMTDREPASSKDPSVLARKGRYDDIDFSIPKGVAEEAQRGLDWRAEHGRGGTDVGVATARTLVSEQRVSPDKARHVAEYFPRHEGDSKGQGYSPGEDGFPSNGRIAWALWGGDAGRVWSEKLVEQMRARDEVANKSRFSHLVDVLPVVKSIEGEREFVAFGVVLEPEPNDGAGDLHRETYSEEFVRQTAHDYTAYFMNLDDQHGEFLPLTKAVVVESYVTKQPETWGARTVKKGSWILGVRVTDPALKTQILSGAKTGLSIEGFAERVPNTPQSAAPLPEHRAPEP